MSLGVDIKKMKVTPNHLLFKMGRNIIIPKINIIICLLGVWYWNLNPLWIHQGNFWTPFVCQVFLYFIANPALLLPISCLFQPKLKIYELILNFAIKLVVNYVLINVLLPVEILHLFYTSFLQTLWSLCGIELLEKGLNY